MIQYEGLAFADINSCYKKIHTMRNIIKISTILTGLVFFSYCKNDTEDFREKYTGNWEYTIATTKLNFDRIGQHENDSTSYLGKIIFGNIDNQLNINYSKDSSIVLNIDESGVLSGFPNQYCSGEFNGNNKIHLFLRWGGLGGFMQCNIYGTKK